MTTNPKTLARMVGILYLMLFALGPVAFLMGRAELFGSTDAAASFTYIVENESAVRIGMTAEALVVVIEIIASAMLYVLFRGVSRHLSMAAMLARFGQAVIQGVNLLWGALLLGLAGGAGYLAHFDQGQMEGLTQLFLDVNGFMIHVWGIFFGVHLALLAWLVNRSEFMPRWLGWLLGLGAVGYLSEGFGAILAPGSAELLATLVLVLAIPAELAFTVWLVWRGVDQEAWQSRVAIT